MESLRFKAIQDRFGKEPVAWLGTGQICTEELAFPGALAKFGMGMVHGDGNTRQCMATAATAYKQSFDLILPAAGWGEKVGTFINSERRIGLVKKVARAPGQALSDFNIFKLVAQYWGCGKMFEKWSSPKSVFQILKELSCGQPCEITGIRDYRMIEDAGGIQWPWPNTCRRTPTSDGHLSTESEKAIETERRLF